MTQSHPTEKLGWSEPEESDPDNYTDVNKQVAFQKINLSYPDEMHDLHNDCSSAPDNDYSLAHDYSLE